jgi:tetratricopeptide (TPR) repeat protein
MSEKAYVRLVEEGSSFFKRAMDAKTPKNKISLAEKAIKSFETTIETAKKIDLKAKIPILYEYITQLNMMIAVAYLDLKTVDKCITAFNLALISNKSAGTGSKQTERFAYIFAELAKISARIEQIKMATSYANQSLGYAKDLGTDDYLDLLVDLHPLYIKALDINKVEANYHQMVKLAKRTERKKIKAQIYFDYGQYLFDVKKDYKESREYLKKVISLFEAMHVPELNIIQNYYDSKFDKDGNPIIPPKEEKKDKTDEKK